MWISVAAETPAVAEVSNQLIVVVGGVITTAIVTLGGVAIAMFNSRASRTTSSPPAPTTSINEHELYERTAVLRNRADDSDERDEVQDRRLDQIERVLDLENPEWRRR